MNVNGTRGIGMGIPGDGATKRQSNACRRSAEPDEDVDARLPCWKQFDQSGRSKKKEFTNFDHPGTCASSHNSSSSTNIE